MYKITNDYLFLNSQKYGNHPVIREKNGVITYQELEEQANCFGIVLRELGIQKRDRVAIYLENSINFIISIFAIFKSAGVFVPLPYKAPIERISHILKDCSPKVVITNSEKLADILGIIDEKDTYCVIIIGPKESAPRADKNCKLIYWDDCINQKHDYFNENNDITNLAYIIYTSGSTGNPKGVAIRHQGLMNYTEATVETYNYDTSTRNFCMSPFYFDGSLGSIFCTILAGGCLTIYNQDLVIPRLLIKKLISDEITHFGCTPGLFITLVQNLTPEQAKLLKIKTVGIGGETCPKHYIRDLKTLIPGVRIFNRYGPTETVVVASGYEITDQDLIDDREIPIGKPLKNVYYYAFNSEGLPIKPGEVAELYIGGVQVMECYWNDPELTRSALREDLVAGQVVYKTGDLVTIDTEGNYVFVGRTDDMIKRNGFRIYLSEIEKALREFEWLKDCANFSITNGEKNEIATFIVTQGQKISESEIRNELNKKIPVYMIPDIIKLIDDIPYTSIGKIDRKKLLSMI